MGFEVEAAVEAETRQEATERVAAILDGANGVNVRNVKSGDPMSDRDDDYAITWMDNDD